MSWLARQVRPRPLASLAAGGIGLAMLAKLTLGTASAESHSSTPRKTFTGGPALMSLPLESSESVNHNTKRLRFKLPQEDAISGLPLTSALLTVSFPNGSWLPVPRPYTPISPSDAPGFLDLLVKQYPSGRASTHLHSLQPGDKLFFATTLKGPAWKPNACPHVALVAGGAGITPAYQLAQGILRNPDDRTAVTLVFGVNGDEDVLLKEELEGFVKEFPGRFRVVYTVSRPGAGSVLRKGYVTRELLEEVLPEKRGDTKVFVCGPPAMEEALVGKKWSTGVLHEIGYRKDQIQKF